MSCLPQYSRALALGLMLLLLPLSDAFAHCFVGPRFLPATLVTDDPCVADELSLPTVAWSKTGDVPPATQWDISGELSKRITEDFGVSIGEDWSQIRQPGSPTLMGFGDLETTFQYQLLKDGCARDRDAARPDRRLGRHRRDQCRDRNLLQPAHAHLLFRPGVRPDFPTPWPGHGRSR